MDEPADLPPPSTPDPIRAGIAASEALDTVLRRCATHAAAAIELGALLRANALREWAQRPGSGTGAAL